MSNNGDETEVDSVSESESKASVPEVFDHVKVGVRLAPLTEEEVRMNYQSVIELYDKRLIAFHPYSREGLVYNFDFCFPSSASQSQIFDEIGSNIIHAVIDGYSCAVLSYGPARTGKTETFFGNREEPGLINMILKEGFSYMGGMPKNFSYTVKFSFWDMNSDSILDLLEPDKTNVKVRRAPDQINIANLAEEIVESWEDLQDLIDTGISISQNEGNKRGTRWHNFLRLKLIREDVNHPEEIVESSLLFVNLKGPDRVGKLGLKGEQLKQGANLNKSLTALGNAIYHVVKFSNKEFKAEMQQSNATGQINLDSTHTKIQQAAPAFFGDSKLTRVLSEALSGKYATTILASISPCESHYIETIDTLENLLMARKIKTKPVRGVSVTSAGQVKLKLDRLKSKLPEDRMAPDHPLTELQEKVLKLEQKYNNIVNHGEHYSPEPTQRQEPPPMKLPRGQLWKKHEVKSLKHGTRNTVYHHTAKGLETYKGQYEGNRKSGFGTHQTDKYKYEGEWKDGVRHGEGTFWVKNSEGKFIRTYKGEWAFGKKDGFGAYYYSNGDIYEGEWKEGKRCGLGKLFYANGDKYEGQWHDDKMSGVGTIYFANGDRFEGHFLNGLKEGPGAYYYEKKGQKYEGEWHKGTAKCGTISAIDPSKPLASFGESLIPKIELANPGGVIEEQVNKIRSERSAELYMSQDGHDIMINNTSSNEEEEEDDEEERAMRLHISDDHSSSMRSFDE